MRLGPRSAMPMAVPMAYFPPTEIANEENGNRGQQISQKPNNSI
jgi:hypothetical protein